MMGGWSGMGVRAASAALARGNRWGGVQGWELVDEEGKG